MNKAEAQVTRLLKKTGISDTDMEVTPPSLFFLPFLVSTIENSVYFTAIQKSILLCVMVIYDEKSYQLERCSGIPESNQWKCFG